MSSGSGFEWIEENSASENEIGGAQDDQEDAKTPIEDDGGFVVHLNGPQPVVAVVLKLEAVVCCSKCYFVGKSEPPRMAS
jgi:hypothetical protein